MNKSELLELERKLNNEHDRRQRLGGYDANAPSITFLTTVCLLLTRHLIQMDKEFTKVKREVRPRKNKI